MPESARQPLGTTGWWIWSHFTVRSTGFSLAELNARCAGRDNGEESDESQHTAQHA